MSGATYRLPDGHWGYPLSFAGAARAPHQSHNEDTEGAKQYKYTTDGAVNLGQGTVTHSFIVISECPFPFLGQDLLSKLQATISFFGTAPSPPKLQLGEPAKV